MLFTDVRLPDLSGIELARRIAAHSPNIRVIFASGDAILPEEVQGLMWQSLRKPYTLQELEEAMSADA